MRLLALESATGAAAVSVASEEGVLVELTVRTARRHVELLHPLMAEALALSDTALDDLDGVAADVGPGLFTGIRVGLAAAKALAVARRLPVVGVTSLETLAHAAAAGGVPADEIVPVVDLRRGEVAWRLGGETFHGPPAELSAALAERDEVLFCGDGARRYQAELTGRAGWRVAGESLATPPVASLAVLAIAALGSGRGIDPAALAPCYLREADARINWTTRHDSPAGRGERHGA